DLILKKEIGREPLRLGGINSAHSVLKGESGGRRRAVEIVDLQLDRNCRFDVEQDGYLTAEADILRPLADVEENGRLPFAGLTAVDESEHIFNFQAAEFVGHRRGGEHVDFEESILDVVVLDLAGF